MHKVYSYSANPIGDVKKIMKTLPEAEAQRYKAQLAIVNDQMRLAHRYRNRLVEVELRKDDATNAALVEIEPRIAETQRLVDSLDAAITSAYAEMRKANSDARDRLSHDTAAVTALKKERAELYARLKTLRKDAFAADAWKEVSKTLNEAAVEARKEIRAESGLYWGTYLHVEQSIDDAAAHLRKKGLRVRFRAWDGGGHLAVQIQKGILATDAIGGNDTRIWIEPPAPGADPEQKRRARVKIRVQSDGRAPVWAEFQTTIHRPLPPDSVIKWVHVVRRRLGTHDIWSIQFVISRKEWETDTASATGAVGVDLGWRMRPEGLCVAVWCNEAGDTGRIVLPNYWLNPLSKARDIAMIRSMKFNAALAKLRSDMVNLDLPSWWAEATPHMASWKSPARLSTLAIRWRTNRFNGDAAAFDDLEAWRKNDKHLLEYEVNLVDTFQARRRDLYRNAAAQLRRRYAKIFVEDMDMRRLHRLPDASDADKGKYMRLHMRDAAVSILRLALAGPWLSEVDARGTTKECSRCGHSEDRDGAKLMHTCSKCMQVFDIDENAAKNILKRGLAVSSDASAAVGALAAPIKKRRRTKG